MVPVATAWHGGACLTVLSPRKSSPSLHTTSGWEYLDQIWDTVGAADRTSLTVILARSTRGE
jgi:hypothetical protein